MREARDGIDGCKRHAQGGAREGARGEVRGSGCIAQSSGRSYVERSSFKETFDYFIGEGGGRGTEGFHEGLIRKVDVQVTEICLWVRLPETPLRTPARRSDLDVGRVVLAGTSP